MSDRFDSRIRAFVVELLNDPPEAPPFPQQDAVTVNGGNDSPRRGQMTDTDQTQRAPEANRNRRGLLVAAGAAAVVLIVGVALAASAGLFSGDDVELAAGESRVIEVTFDGVSCSYPGPTELTAGDVQIIYHNASEGDAWGDLGLLLGDTTIEDAIEYTEDPPAQDRPSFVQGMWSNTLTPAGEASTGTAELGPGSYVLTVGSWSPYQGHVCTGLTVTE